jgi:hypothetical protein
LFVTGLDLLIDVVDKIRVRAENRVEKALVADLKRVRGKHGLLFALAGAAVDHPDETVRTALYPVVSEATLRQLVKEAKASELLFRQRVRKEIRGSYSHHYRRMLPHILDTLEFRCANSIYRPVMDVLELLQGHVNTPGQQRFYPPGDHVPIAGVVPDQWREAVIDEHGKIERIPYELSVLRALRDALRRREIYVSGAHRWRDPDEDMPVDLAKEAARLRLHKLRRLRHRATLRACLPPRPLRRSVSPPSWRDRWGTSPSHLTSSRPGSSSCTRLWS